MRKTALTSRGATFNGLGEGVFVSVFDVHAHGDTTGQAGEFDAGGAEPVDEIGGGCLPRDGGTGGDQYLFHRAVADSGKEFLDLQFIRADAVDWGDNAMEDMIVAAKGRGLFDGEEIARFLDDADQSSVPFGVGADRAGIIFGKGKAAGAELDGGVEFGQGLGKFQGVGRRSPEDIEGQPGCGLFADTRQFAKGLDQPFERGGNNLHQGATGLKEIGEAGQIEAAGELAKFLLA